MERMKCCPKCGSTNINFLAFYRPSIWKCLDCGYEGAFIIEDSEIAEKMQERYRLDIAEEIRTAVNARLKEWDAEFPKCQAPSPPPSNITTTWD